jgi:hypothetical protein
MALQFGDNHYCKVTHFENQKATTRRVTCIEVHRADGRVVRLRGSDLPDSLCIQTGPESDSDGKGFLQVIELPEQAFASAASAPQGASPGVQVTVENNAGRAQQRFFTARDGFIFCVGMLAATVVSMLGFSAWLELHEFHLKTTPTATYQPDRPRY